MKSRYLDIMARVVDVYDDARFDKIIAKTKEQGISEHGFPRLCANIGILMAHGRKLELRHRFDEMMAICCRDIPLCPKEKSKRGNDFSIRELTACVLELESAKLYSQETISYWKQCLAGVDPKNYYRMVAPEPPIALDNWAAFNAASELARCFAGLADTYSYIENQIASQMFSFDENGMYRDPNDPMVYDIVARSMLSSCLYYGYNGSHRKLLEEHLRKAGKLTLLMQSVTGETPYGGRSNQFLHNEAHLTVCLEFEAAAHKKLGDPSTAAQFKAAANLALDTIEHWLDAAPGQHIKNYFPPDSMIGCENYAYYDKYMVTIASFLYLAYLFCDDSIPATHCPASDNSCHTWQTSDAFRKLFCKAGSYFLELETSSDHHYDCEGIGRIHRRGAPSAICLSVPVSKNPNYGTPSPNACPLSICCGKQIKDTWIYGYDPEATMTVQNHSSTEKYTNATLLYSFNENDTIDQLIQVSEQGVTLTLIGEGMLGLTLPAFFFDGIEHSCINFDGQSLSVQYKGWTCSYITDGFITDLEKTSTNRNGTYRIFRAQGKNVLHVKIFITPNK